ncbi:hypothetical protein [Variovorax sp.]|uniref:hypothetical protein n=1 Tax=Variovorax sp. TaxID=1871043 RepID=UPI003BABEC2B
MLLVGSLALVAVGGWNWFSKFLESSAASWIQAVGSVLAILAAGRIASWQLSETRRTAIEARRERKRAMLEVIATLAQLLILEVEARAAFLDDRSITETQLKRFLTEGEPFEDIETSASQIPVHDLDDVQTVRLVFDLLRLTRLARTTHVKIRNRFFENLNTHLDGGTPYGIVIAALNDLGAKCALSINALKEGNQLHAAVLK